VGKFALTNAVYNMDSAYQKFVLQVPGGKYYVSILVKTEHGELPHTDGKTGMSN